MREALLAEEFEKLRTAKRKGKQQGDVGQSDGSGSGTRRTRSQAAPEWTVQDALILVNEIAAVEGDCADALSTYQKWTIIAENCTALDVPRNSNQCRRKWDSLLEEYRMIAEWEMRRKGVSYWSLDSGRRKKATLPLDFSEDLFKAIVEVVKTQEERSGTDPDTDPETEFDAFKSKETGSRKPRRPFNHHKSIIEEKDNQSTENELPRLSAPHKMVTKEKASTESDSQRRSAHCKGINEGKKHVSTEKWLQRQSTSCIGLMEHASPENESEHARTPQKAITEETEHIVIENEPQYFSTSFKGSTQKEHASIYNYSQCQSAPYKGSSKENEHVSVENESQNVATRLMENSEEIEHVSVGNNSWYQLAPGIMEEKEHVLAQNESLYQSTPINQVSEEEEHGSTKNAYNSAVSGAEKRKQLLVAKLRENAQLIHAIIAGNASQNTVNMPADMKYEEALEMKTARQKADELILCIADLAKNLDFLNNVVEECQGVN